MALVDMADSHTTNTLVVTYLLPVKRWVYEWVIWHVAVVGHEREEWWSIVVCPWIAKEPPTGSSAKEPSWPQPRWQVAKWASSRPRTKPASTPASSPTISRVPSHGGITSIFLSYCTKFKPYFHVFKIENL